MSVPLIATKLQSPRAQRNLVPRPHLIERLDEGLHRPLTLISAPAGSGKTSALRAWIAGHDQRIAWLSLDKEDNDPTRFWTYAIAALQRLRPDLGSQARALLQARGRQPQQLESILTVLLNEIAALSHTPSTSPGAGASSEPAVTQASLGLVLDDYHLIDNPVIHAGITFLVDHLPAHMHLVVASRTDPPLPLARLRAGNLLAELRFEELRFTAQEVALFLNQVMGLALTIDDVAALEARTEGWIAGLQLAALSLQGRDEDAQRRFVSAFAGSQRYILDYLVEEVLQRQAESTQAFLLQTSVLEYLTGSLCDALTGRTDGQAMLDELERANLFLFPLDEVRRWYRYHQLFAEVLRLRLQHTEPERVPVLHRQAAIWYEAHDLIDDVMHHALAEGDATWTARLIERYAEEILGHGEGETLRRWLAAVPQEIGRARPRLLLIQAIAAFNAGGLEAAEALLDEAEQALTTIPGEPYTPSIGRQASALANIPAAIALQRASLVGLRGDAERVTTLVRAALSHLADDEQGPRLAVRWNLARADWMRGCLTEAERAFADLVAQGQAAGEAHLMLGASAALGRVQRAQGRLGAALRTNQEALAFAARIGTPAVPAAAVAHVGMAEVYYQRNQLEQARHHAMAGIPLGRQLISTLSPAIGLVTLAWVRQAAGDLAGAREAIDEAYQTMPAHELAALHNPVPAERARLLLAQGEVREATHWAEARGLGEMDELSYPREREYLVLARVLLAQNEPERALSLLERLSAVAESHGRVESVIEARLLAALALAACGEQTRALAALAEALALARPEGYVRMFADEGAAMGALLRQVSGELRPYAAHVLVAFSEAQDLAPRARLERSDALVEPLTEREREVLRALATGLSNRALAQRFSLSLATVKVHLKHIYAKLAVHSRTQAVARARELNVL